MRHQLALNAARRAAALTHLDLRRGLASLATIASTASLLGLFLTALGIVGSFRGFSGNKAQHLGVVFAGSSEAFIFAAFGLAVSLLALAIRHLLEIQLGPLFIDIAHTATALLGTI